MVTSFVIQAVSGWVTLAYAAPRAGFLALPTHHYGWAYPSRHGGSQCATTMVRHRHGSRTMGEVDPLKHQDRLITNTESGSSGLLRYSRSKTEHFVVDPTKAAHDSAFQSAVRDSPHFEVLDGDGFRGGISCQDLKRLEPMERVVVTANANLQRIISAYYHSPVTVDVRRNVEVGHNVFDREVSLSVLGKPCCSAKSVVVLHSPVCVSVASRGHIGVGQLFKTLEVLPTFELLAVGHAEDPSGANEPSDGSTKGGLWRIYDLRSEHLSCRIYEQFTRDLLSLEDEMEDHPGRL